MPCPTSGPFPQRLELFTRESTPTTPDPPTSFTLSLFIHFIYRYRLAQRLAITSRQVLLIYTSRALAVPRLRNEAMCH